VSEANHPESTVVKDYSRPKRLEQHVDQYDFDETPQKKVSRIATMERTYFSIFFRKKVGITFTDWLRRLRIAKAILKTGDQP
jgi:AraC-like DNA-binding protein